MDALTKLYALLYGTLISKKYNTQSTFTTNYCCSKHTKTWLIKNFLLKLKKNDVANIIMQIYIMYNERGLKMFYVMKNVRDLRVERRST